MIAQTSAYKLVLAAGDVRDVHVVGGRGQVFQLLAGEDVNGDDVDLGVAVLARLGLGDAGDLARVAVEDDVAALLELVRLHREGGRRAGVGAGGVGPSKRRHQAGSSRAGIGGP